MKNIPKSKRLVTCFGEADKIGDFWFEEFHEKCIVTRMNKRTQYNAPYPSFVSVKTTIEEKQLLEIINQYQDKLDKVKEDSYIPESERLVCFYEP